MIVKRQLARLTPSKTAILKPALDCPTGGKKACFWT